MPGVDDKQAETCSKCGHMMLWPDKSKHRVGGSVCLRRQLAWLQAHLAQRDRVIEELERCYGASRVELMNQMGCVYDETHPGACGRRDGCKGCPGEAERFKDVDEIVRLHLQVINSIDAKDAKIKGLRMQVEGMRASLAKMWTTTKFLLCVAQSSERIKEQTVAVITIEIEKARQALAASPAVKPDGVWVSREDFVALLDGASSTDGCITKEFKEQMKAALERSL